ncbi:377_t:CDS:1, partial [Gigaspora margarita]
KHRRHYHLIGSFDNNDAPKLPLYQTGKEIYWENGEDTRYGYSKLSPDELIMENLLGNKQTKDTPGSNVNTVPTVEDIQDLFNIA